MAKSVSPDKAEHCDACKSAKTCRSRPGRASDRRGQAMFAGVRRRAGWMMVLVRICQDVVNTCENLTAKCLGCCGGATVVFSSGSLVAVGCARC